MENNSNETNALRMIEDRVSEIERKLKEIDERNRRVENDKAWEVSKFRVLVITLMTYVITAIVFKLIGVKDFLLSAFIPTIGFFLSTQSLPFIKKYWIGKRR